MPEQATVVRRTDPARLGRIKVRIHGIHSETIHVDDLPWATPSNGLTTIDIPPLGSSVWVDLRNNDHEYPVYRRGWWGIGEMPSGAKVNRWPLSIFGSDQRYDQGPLMMEKGLENLVPEDAPNNFVRMNPIGARLELDARKGRTKLLLSDHLDNGMWINSQDGVITTEAWASSATRTNPQIGTTWNTQKQFFQSYTRDWKFSLADRFESRTGIAEIAFHNGATFRMKENGGEFEVWTLGGYRFVVSTIKSRVEITTPQNQGLIVDDRLGKVTLHSGREYYVHLDRNNRKVELRSAGDIHLMAEGKINLSANGPITFDGSQVHFNSGFSSFSSAALVPSTYLDSAFTYTNQQDRGTRAWEYSYYQDPEKTS